MIDLEYFTEELKTDGFEVAVFIDANETLDHRFRSQNHNHKYKSDKGFHIDGSIDGSIATYTRNCGLSNTLSVLNSRSPNRARAHTHRQVRAL
jgi:xanthine dehydrogenase molybdopterin-binding subunit B